MMKVKYNYKGKQKIYEYPTTTMLVNIETRNRIKVHASKNEMSIKDFVCKLVDDYEDTSD